MDFTDPLPEVLNFPPILNFGVGTFSAVNYYPAKLVSLLSSSSKSSITKRFTFADRLRDSPLLIAATYSILVSNRRGVPKGVQ